VPIIEIPKPPSWLNSEAKRAWKRLSHELKRLGLLTVIDIEAFTAACQAYGIWVECERYYKKTNPVTGNPYGRTYEYVNKNGATNIIARPEVAIGNKALDQFKALLGEFGMTPSSRAGIEITNTPDADPMEALLSGVR